MVCSSRPSEPHGASEQRPTSLRLPICECPNSSTCQATHWSPLYPNTTCQSTAAFDVKFHTKRHRAPECLSAHCRNILQDVDAQSPIPIQVTDLTVILFL